MLPEALTIETYICLFDEKRPDIRKFWLELTGLTSGVNYTYQYWVEKQRQLLIPRIGKTSDPYSTLVLSPYDDGGIQLQLILICLFIQ
jgi:hypothetical protein